MVIQRLMSLAQPVQPDHQDPKDHKGRLVQQEAPLTEIRKVLVQKKNCLDIISRLEATERHAKQAWDNGRHQWTARGRSQLHLKLGQVGEIIEKILICEEENDLQLIQQTGAV